MQGKKLWGNAIETGNLQPVTGNVQPPSEGYGRFTTFHVATEGDPRGAFEQSRDREERE